MDAPLPPPSCPPVTRGVAVIGSGALMRVRCGAFLPLIAVALEARKRR